MNIVLDSNIYRRDILLKSKDFEIMLDYLKKTTSSLIVPQIILDEITGLYKRTLNDRVNTYKSSFQNLQLTLASETKLKDDNSIEIESEALSYIKFLRSKLKIHDVNILPYDNSYLPVIAKRAINRQKPSGEKGQGFRDTLIWLTIVDYCKNSNNKQVIFISENTEDFGDSDKTSLHDSLKEECKSNNIEIHFYKSMKEFVEKHSKRIEFVTNDWINDILTESLAQHLVAKELVINKKRVVKAIERRTGKDSTDYFALMSVNTNITNEHFVYELSNDIIVVNIFIESEIEVEFEYEIDSYDKLQNDLIRLKDFYDTNVSRSNIMLSAYASLTVKNKEIIDSRLENTDIY